MTAITPHEVVQVCPRLMHARRRTLQRYTSDEAHRLPNLSFALFQADTSLVRLETRRAARATPGTDGWGRLLVGIVAQLENDGAIGPAWTVQAECLQCSSSSSPRVIGTRIGARGRATGPASSRVFKKSAERFGSDRLTVVPTVVLPVVFRVRPAFGPCRPRDSVGLRGLEGHGEPHRPDLHPGRPP